MAIGFYLTYYPSLDDALIIVNFMSIYPSLFKQEVWGTFSNYSITL